MLGRGALFDAWLCDGLGEAATRDRGLVDVRAAASVVEAGELQQAADGEREEGSTAEEGGLGIMKEAAGCFGWGAQRRGYILGPRGKS